MKTALWSRIAGATGLVAIAALFAFDPYQGPLNLAPSQMTAEEVSKYLVDSRAEVIRSAFVDTVGAALLLWFVGSIWLALSIQEAARRLAMVSLGGGIAAAVLLITGRTIFPLLAVTAADLRAEGVAAAAGNVGGVISTILLVLPLGVMAGAASLASIRSGVFPKLLGWLGVIAAALPVLLTILGVLIQGDLFYSSEFTLAGFGSGVVILLTYGWLAVLSLVLTLHPETAQ